MKSQPKRHHVVPRLLLKEFVTEAGKLFAYDRRTPERGVFQERIENIFVERHYYSYQLDGGGKDPSPEYFLSSLEGEVAPVLARMIASARRGLLEPLNAYERSLLDAFMYFQWKRSPDSISARMLDGFDEQIDIYIDRFEQEHRPLTSDERAFFSLPEARARLRHNARAGAAVAVGEAVLPALAETGLHVARILHPRKSYIIGSRPVVKLASPGDTQLGSPNVEYWLPISFDVALVWCGASVYRLALISDERLVRNTNRAIARQSTVVAARSLPLVRSIVAIEPSLATPPTADDVKHHGGEQDH